MQLIMASSLEEGLSFPEQIEILAPKTPSPKKRLVPRDSQESTRARINTEAAENFIRAHLGLSLTRDEREQRK